MKTFTWNIVFAISLFITPSIIFADECTSSTVLTDLQCQDEDDDCQVCEPKFDDYTIYFENASNIDWTPNTGSSGCFPNQELGSTPPTSYCNYSISGNELTFFFNESGYGMPQISNAFSNNVHTFQAINSGSSSETLFLGFSFGNYPVIPEEMYFFSCGALTVDSVTVQTCIAMQHNTGALGHYWLLGAPSEYVFDSFESNPYPIPWNYGTNAAIITSCFNNDDFSGATNQDTMSLSSTTNGTGWGSQNCSCLVNNIDCDDINLNNQTVNSINNSTDGALKILTAWLKLLKTITKDVSNALAYSGGEMADADFIGETEDIDFIALLDALDAAEDG